MSRTGDRVAVLATSRSPSSQRSAALAELVQRFAGHRNFQRLQLEGLDLPSIESLLSRLGMDEPGAAGALHDVTRGHPFFLSEILQTADWRQALAEPPPGVRAFVYRRVAALGDAVEGILIDAAGLRIAFDAGLPAEISHVPERTSATLIDTAVAAGLLRPVGKGTFTFVHELGRRALLDRLDAQQRARLHERIAGALEHRDVPSELAAAHRAAAATEIDLRGPSDDTSRPGGRVLF